MTDASRRVYLGLGRAFVAIGVIVALGSVLDRALGWGFFSGSPLGTAALLGLIGALLLWTVRQAGAGTVSADADAGADPDADAGDDAAGSPAGAVAGEPPDRGVERL